MEKKLILLLFYLFIMFSCSKTSKNDTKYYESLKRNTYIILNNNKITVFSYPLDFGKYGCTLIFGGALEENKFIEGYFLEKSKNKKNIFDTIYSNKDYYINFKLYKNKLIVKMKSKIIGCNIIFYDSSVGYSNKCDTLEIKLINNKIIGVALPNYNIIVKEKKTNLLEIENRPMLIIKNEKDSLDVIFMNDDKNLKYSRMTKKEGRVAKKDCKILN